MSAAARAIATQVFARHLGIELVDAETDRAVLRMPWQAFLGEDRVNGGAISSLVDLAATCAFWSHPSVGDDARGATIGFSINYLHLCREEDLLAGRGTIGFGSWPEDDPGGSVSFACESCEN